VEKQYLITKFEQFNHFNIIVIGDVMIDTYMWGNVDRISPEAPVPVVVCKKQENRLGGAANVAINIQSLGAKPILCSVIGNDSKSAILLDLMQQNNLTTDGIIQDQSRVTTVKTRVISLNQHLLRIDEETTKNIQHEMEISFIERITQIITNESIHAILFEDYDKGVITPFVIQQIVSLANKHQIPTLVDPKKRNFSNYHHVSLFKPNFKELNEGLKLELRKGDIQGLIAASQKLHDQMNIQTVLVTLSELGVFVSNKKENHEIPAHLREITDVSGAGDTVISTASLCMAARMSEKEIAAISNLAGGIVCEKVGVVPINKQQLLTECLKELHALS